MPQDPVNQKSRGSSFDWHNYITLSPNFSPEEVKILSGVLDDISQAHDGDGKELIMKAGMRNCGKLNFVPGGRNNYDDSKPEIQISFRDAGRTAYKEKGVERLASMNGIIVHELFHAGDPNPTNAELMHYANNNLDKLLTQYGYDDAKKKEVSSEISHLLEQKTARYFTNGLTTVQLQRVLHMVSIKSQGFPAIAEMIEKIPPEKFQQSLIAEGIVGNDGTKPWEARAVAYTDAFMKKNYGDKEPQRSSYANGKLLDEVQPIKILTHSPNAVPGTDFPANASGANASECSMPTIKSAVAPDDRILNISLTNPESVKSLQDFGNCLHAVQASCNTLPESAVSIPLSPLPEHKSFLKRISHGLFK